MQAFAATMDRHSAARPETDEIRWVDAARRGDEEAFAELVRRHQHRVFRLAGRFFRHREQVEDVAQETFLAAWRKLHTYRARAPFEHWLTRVCLNTCYARLRKARHRESPLEREPAVAASDPGAALDAVKLLARLPPADRFVLVLLHGEGRSTREIAELTGWSRANVKVRAHRARKRLRRLLEAAP